MAGGLSTPTTTVWSFVAAINSLLTAAVASWGLKPPPGSCRAGNTEWTSNVRSGGFFKSAHLATNILVVGAAWCCDFGDDTTHTMHFVVQIVYKKHSVCWPFGNDWFEETKTRSTILTANPQFSCQWEFMKWNMFTINKLFSYKITIWCLYMYILSIIIIIITHYHYHCH